MMINSVPAIVFNLCKQIESRSGSKLFETLMDGIHEFFLLKIFCKKAADDHKTYLITQHAMEFK